eukprot:3937924-Rhodomonas_salina.1
MEEQCRLKPNRVDFGLEVEFEAEDARMSRVRDDVEPGELGDSFRDGNGNLGGDESWGSDSSAEESDVDDNTLSLQGQVSEQADERGASGAAIMVQAPLNPKHSLS